MFYKQRGTDRLVYLDYSDHWSHCNVLHILGDGYLNLILARDINVYMKWMTEDLGFVTIMFPWSPLKDSVIVLWPSPSLPPPSPPSLTINWQSIFHSIPFILCLSFQNPWLPPQEKMTGSLLQLLFKPTRFSRTKEWDRQTTPNKSLKAFCVSSWLRSLQTATTICKWRGHEKPIQPNSGREHHPCFTCNYDLREKIISPKFYNNRIVSLAIVTQAMTAILISGPMPVTQCQ